MNTKLIIFSHHYVDETIKNRFLNLKQLNPTWDVLSIGFEGYDLIPNSLIVNKKKYPSNVSINYHVPDKSIDWFDCDLFAYDVYLQKPDYKEYFLYEYDTICNVSIDSFFDTNVNFFGSTVCNPGSESWEWVKLYRKHNLNNKKFPVLYSYGQSTCIYFKNEILKLCVNEILNNKFLYDNMFCEVRGGTIVSKFTDLKKGKSNIEKYISWTPNDIKVDLSIPHFYHPVK